MTQNNLGNAYVNLAGQEEKKKNLLKSIDAYEKALKVYTLQDLPIKYATTQNNLGNAYRYLAGQEEKKNNLLKAINAYEEALNVFIPENYPLQFDMVSQNLFRILISNIF